MSPINDKTSKKWVSDAVSIDINAIDEIVYTNKAIDTFLRPDGWLFLSANKGMGKTLLMTYKRYLVEKAHSSACLIPQGKPYLDNMTIVSEMSRKTQEFMGDEKVAIRMWMFSLHVSIISYMKLSLPDEELNKYTGELSVYRMYLNGEKNHINPTDVFRMLMQSSPNEIAKVLQAGTGLDIFCKNNIHSEVRIFIDRVDQALKNLLQKTWILVQGALLEAAFNLYNGNNHIKIYATIRQEAFSNYASDIKGNLIGSTLQLFYGKKELIDIVDKLAKYYEGSNDLEQFIGRNKTVKTLLRVEENTVDFIVRHSLHRPRDIVSICSELSIHADRNDARDLINTVVRVANDQIVPFVFDESIVFLDSLKEMKQRAEFMKILKRNIMTYEDILDLYTEYNNIERSLMGELGLDDNKFYHPFSELYKVGLLGVVTEESAIKFKMPSDYQDFQSLKLPVSDYYLIHPALSRYIVACDNEQYKAFKFIVTGHDVPWDQELNVFLITVQNILFKINNTEFCKRVLKFIEENLVYIAKHYRFPNNRDLHELIIDLDLMIDRANGDHRLRDYAIELWKIMNNSKTQKQDEKNSPKKFNAEGEWEMTESYDYGRAEAQLIIRHVPDMADYNLTGRITITDIMDRGVRFKVEEDLIGHLSGPVITLKGTSYKILEGNIEKYYLDKWFGEFRDENTVIGTSVDENSVSGRFMFIRRQ